MQYTIRGIPPELDKALRARARKTGKSLNETTLDLMKNGIYRKKKEKYRDMHQFVGTMTFDHEFEEAMKWHDALPNRLFDNV